MDTKKNNGTALTQKQAQLPIDPGETDIRTEVGALGSMKYPDGEASFSMELDRIMKLSVKDPLLALDQMVAVMQGLNTELLKASAPAILENARRKADHFATKGKIEEDKREGSRSFNQLLRLEEAVVKMGIAQTKVRDELERRNT